MFQQFKPNYYRNHVISLVCCLILFSLQPLFSQTYVKKKWQALYGDNNIIDTVRWSNTCAFDSLGNLFVAGSKILTGGHSGILTVKLNTSGDTLWERTYQRDAGQNDFAVKIGTDKTTAVYVICASHSTIGKWDWELIKYNLSGVRQWIVTYNGMANQDDIPTGVAIDGEGNPIVTGYSSGIVSHEDFYTVKYNSSGTMMWSASYDNNNLQDIPTAIAIGPFDDVYVTGGTTNTLGNREVTTIEYAKLTGAQIAFNRQSSTTNALDLGVSIKIASGDVYVAANMSDNGGNYQIATIKYNSGLTQQWIKKYFGDSLYNEARGIDVDGSGNVYTIGFKNDTNGTGRTMVTLKYTSSGFFLWSQLYKNKLDSSEPVAIQHDGRNIYIAATNHSDTSNATIICYDTSGNFIWERQLNLSNGESATATDLQLSTSGVITSSGTRFYGDDSYKNYYTIRYETFRLDNTPQRDETTGKPKYAKNYIMIRFRKEAVNSTTRDNTDIPFGSPSDFLTSTAISELNTALGYSISSEKMGVLK
jgi:hypothetical protein